MTDNPAGSLRRSSNPEVEAIMARRGVAKTQSSTADSRFAEIASNPFYSTAMDPSTSPEEKLKSLRKLVTGDGSKTENSEKVQALDQFKAWVQDQREQMASKLMSLSDTGTYAELQSTYNDINHDLDQFNKDMEPLLKIVDAVYKIRTSSTTGVTDAYKAIKEAEASDADRATRLAAVQGRVAVATARAKELTQSIAARGTEKSLFGFGGVKPEAAQAIASMEVERTAVMNGLDALEAEMKGIEAEASSGLGAGTDLDPEALAELRTMLNLSSDEHTRRQKALVQSAISFVNTTKQRVTSITGHLQGQDKQLENIYDANSRMTALYALLNESTTGGKDDTLKLREVLTVVPDGESKIAKMEREEKLRNLDEFIERLETTAADTDLTYADLSTGAIRINTMKSANRNQINKAQAMQTRGIAGVADRLVTTLSAVSSAAINEAQAAAVATNRAMMDVTNRIATNEVIKNATGMDEMNEDLKRTFDDLESYKEAATGAAEISRAALSEMRDSLAVMQKAAEEVQQAAREQVGVAAQVAMGAAPKPGEGKVKKPAPAGAFGFDTGTNG